MTNETRTLAIWGGVAGGAALLGLVWVLVRTSALADSQARTQQLAKDLAAAQPSGLRLDQQLTAAQHSGVDQAKALDEVAVVLAPELKSEYRATDLTSAANRVATDLKALRQRADRSGVKLPTSLPLESGLDSDETVRQMQLAQLSLYRVTLDTVMDAGVQRITTLQPGRAWCDPSGAYAILTAELDIEAPYEVAQAAINGLVAAHKQGIGLRSASLVPVVGKPEAPLRSRFSVSLILPNQPAWKLLPEKIPTPAKSTTASSVKTVGKTAPATPAPSKPTTANSKSSLGDE